MLGAKEIHKLQIIKNKKTKNVYLHFTSQLRLVLLGEKLNEQKAPYKSIDPERLKIERKKRLPQAEVFVRFLLISGVRNAGDHDHEFSLYVTCLFTVRRCAAFMMEGHVPEKSCSQYLV